LRDIGTIERHAVEIATATTVPVMSPRQRRVFVLLLVLFAFANGAFWAWWAQPGHVVSVPQYVVTSLLIAYGFCLPSYFLFFLGRMRRPNPELVPPAELRVAFATTYVPVAESIRVLERTLTAMRDQEGHPHDVWVLDEGDDPDVRQLCERLGVRHFSRKGIHRYQAAAWPYRSKTKAGNYNAWLDWTAEREITYDVLLQMDTDHVPQPGYMMEMLKPFADPAVCYVAAPSIASGNWRESWVVRARFEVEATLHGALQMGYNAGWAPIIIGSHAGFRVAALRAIGGFQRTLAEDHHNTLRLNASGKRGLFSPDAIAIGDGATSFAEAMTQEYQWARALTQILFTYFPRDRSRLPLRIWTELLFAETWYPLFAISQALGFISPAIALTFDFSWVSVDYLAFVGMFAMPTVMCLVIVNWVRRCGWLRPADAPVISWRALLLMLARWPFVLVAVVEATLGAITGRRYEFRITSKGRSGARRLPLRMLVPYTVIVLISLGAIAAHLYLEPDESLDGYAYLTLANAAIYSAVIAAVSGLNAVENVYVHGVPRRVVGRMHVPGNLLSVLALVLVGVVTVVTVKQVGVALPREPVGHVASRARTIPAGPALDIPQNQVFHGLYDPDGIASNVPVDAEQVFVQWKPTVGVEIRTHLARIMGHRRVPFVTVEPYPWNVYGLTKETLFADVAGGRYDPAIRSIAAAVRDVAPDPVYLRFAHEMELTGNFPWSQGNPAGYIAMYRHFATTVRAAGAANARFVWSPAGNAGSDAYFPGTDVTDLSGCTLLEAPRWLSPVSDAPTKSFADRMRQRADVLAPLGKPIVIAEYGISLDDEAAETAWLRDAKADYPSFPSLVGAIYFDAQNPPTNLSPTSPDWQLSPDQLAVFLAP
jgi:cellulose synthase (UDP-forming)